MWRWSGSGGFASAARQLNLSPPVVTRAVAAAVSGFGLTRLMSYQVIPLVDSGALQVVLADFETAPLPVHVVHLEGRRATQKVRGFIDLAVQTLRADPRLNAVG